MNIVTNALLGFIIGILLVLAAQKCKAEVGDVRVGYGTEVLHRKDINQYFIVDVDPIRVMAWKNNYAIGAVDPWGENFKFGIGIVQVHETEKNLGTNLNFLLEGGYCWKRVCAMIEHISHGALLGIEKDKPNAGLNFFTLKFNL